VTDIDELDPPPDDSIVGTPPRHPESVRRTSSILMRWPDGAAGSLQLRGQARDLLTHIDGAAEVLDTATMAVDVALSRVVQRVEVTPARPGLERLVGAQGGSRLRSAIDEAFPGEREQGTPLHFLLDDIAGTSLIAGLALLEARKASGEPFAPALMDPDRPAPTDGLGMRKGRVICSGLRPDGYAQQRRERGEIGVQFLRNAGDLSSDDPWAWHEMDAPSGICMRRRRRIDAWLDDGAIAVDVHFRDSVWNAERVEMAVHEYTVQATIDLVTHELRDIEAVPRVLPFPECPWAAPHAATLVGLDVGGFRGDVQQTLTETHCCTHLNDMLRGLTEVPTFAGAALGR